MAIGLLVAACAAPRRPAQVGGAHEGAAVVDVGEMRADAADEDGDVEASDEGGSDVTHETDGPCPAEMVLVEAEDLQFCIDKYEASLVEIGPDGSEKPYPHFLPVDGHSVRAVSLAGVFPQGFISEVQAEDACEASSKRLCSHREWKTACMGPARTTFPYGEARQPGVCHDAGTSAVGAVFGARAATDPVAAKVRKANAVKGRAAATTKARPAVAAGKSTRSASKAKAASAQRSYSSASRQDRGPAKSSTRPSQVTASVWAELNDPRLGQVAGALERTGSHEACVSGYGAVDMVGNLHEWVKTDASRPRGTFAGGYYLDTSINGDGCQYRTTAHAHDYHDYSTGFRCCAPMSTAD
jgi:hypothetical protein